MVNITESFTKLYKRPPTEEELAALWKLKREQEGWRRDKIIKDLQAPVLKAKREPKVPKPPEPEKPHRWPARASQLAQRVNRMLHLQMTIKEIAFIEAAKENYIKAEIEKWTLPRQNTVDSRLSKSR